MAEIKKKSQKIHEKEVRHREIYHAGINHSCGPYGNNQILTGSHGMEAPNPPGKEAKRRIPTRERLPALYKAAAMYYISRAPRGALFI